ncbi:hypothetical protein G6F42_017816 [Rhizopus arrhizus]|nr:hypothetical protein G6F42_017816 [Rhizopus arrhizus]
MNKNHTSMSDVACSLDTEKLEELMEDQFKDETNTFVDCNINNMHMFQEDKSIKIPTFHAFLDMQVKPFMDEIVEVKVGPMTAIL